MIFLGIFLDTWVQPATVQTQSVEESTLTAVSDKLSLWTSAGNTASHWCTTCVRQNARPLAVLPLTAPRPRASPTQRMKLASLHTGCRKFFLAERESSVVWDAGHWLKAGRKNWSLKCTGALSFILSVCDRGGHVIKESGCRLHVQQEQVHSRDGFLGYNSCEWQFQIWLVTVLTRVLNDSEQNGTFCRALLT